MLLRTRRTAAAPPALAALLLLLAALTLARAARVRPDVPVSAWSAFTSHETASNQAQPRSGPTPNPTKIHSCSQWISVYERHWQQYPDCHRGLTNVRCCELYDVMDKSIRIFNNQLKCKVTNMAFYQRKFSKYCMNGGVATTHTTATTTATTTPPSKPSQINIAPPVTIDGSSGTGEIIILEEELSTHTGVCTTADCCSGQSCCTSCTATTTTTTTTTVAECTTADCVQPCHGQHCATDPCVGIHCSTPCTGTHCSTPCTGTHCSTTPYVCQVGTNCVGVCVNNKCTGVSGGGGGGGGGGNQPNANVCQVGVNCAGVCVNNQCVGVGQSGGNNNDDDDDDDDNVCFHPQNVVHLADGSLKPMRELAVGDRVQVGGGAGDASVVFMFTHRDATLRAAFVNVSVHDGRHIVLTPSHLVYGERGAVAAGAMAVGSRIQMMDGSLQRVASVTRFTGYGLYNPQTMHGDIAVNGFRASTFTTAVRKHTAHALMAPLRALYRISGSHISLLF